MRRSIVLALVGAAIAASVLLGHVAQFGALYYHG